MNIDFIKVACRQSKEGYSVTISIPIPPNEASDVKPFIDEFLGSKWSATIMPALEGGDTTGTVTSRDDTFLENTETGPASDVVTPASPARASLREMTLPQRVALQCQNEVFKTFMVREGKARDAADVPDAVRAYCGVHSRAFILPDTQAAEKWEQLLSRYVAWQHELQWDGE